MKKNKFYILGTLALLLAFGTVLAACGKKDSGGGAASAPKASAPKASGKGGAAEPKLASEADFTVKLTNDGGVQVISYNGSEKDIIIPATIEGLPVTEIGGKVGFGKEAEGSELNSVVIPEGVKVIHSDAFLVRSGRPSLTSVTIPNTVTYIGKDAFVNNSLTDVVIPDSVKKVGTGVFAGCRSLTSITLPPGVEWFKTDSDGRTGEFLAYTALTSFVVPEGVTEIGAGTFKQCTKLTSITLPSTIKRIGGGAFTDCTNLTTITIPDSVTKISFPSMEQGSAFFHVDKLTLATQARLKAVGWDGSYF